MQHHNAGRLSEAEGLYRKILQADPKHPDALHLLGVLANQTGHSDVAVDLIAKALAIIPDYADAHCNLGLALQDLGRLDEAAKSYRKALAITPDYVEVHNNLGNALRGLGRLDEAVDSYRRALALRPDYAEAHNNLGAALKDLDRLDEAIDCYRRALAIKPKYAEAHNNLGTALKDQGKLEEAAESYREALAIAPDYAEMHNNLGNALRDLGRPNEAVACYRQAIAIRPAYAEAHYHLGNALNDLRRLAEAAASYRQALAIAPDHAEALNNLGLTLHGMGQPDEAVDSYRRALAVAPDYAEALNNLGLTLQDMGRLDEAVTSYQQAIVVRPDSAEMHNNLGNALRDLGRMDQATASYRRVLALNPDFAEAHRHLAYITKHAEHDAAVEAMERLYADPDIDDTQKMHLAFGLGKAFEDLRQYEKAFDYFAAGNALKRAGYDYSIDDDAKILKKLKAAFDPSLFARHRGAGCPDDTPIFIVGMPRSGTTLVEQILASHPLVHGAGELSAFTRCLAAVYDIGKFPEGVDRLEDADFARLGAEYVDEIRKHSANARFITDKMPNNRLYLGFIRLALPNARIIHCKRDPADNGLSLFKSYFPAEAHFYAYDLAEIGGYYNLYRELMAHWHAVVPGAVHDVQYEDMVADQVGQTRSLLEYCALEWDDACLEFHKTDRPVMTASAEQVRRPMYKSSVQAWKRYEKPLAPMLAVLRRFAGDERSS